MHSPPPSPPPPPTPPSRLHHHHHHRHNHNNITHHHLLPLLAVIATVLTLFIVLLILLSIFLHRKLSLPRTTPNPNNLQRFSFSLLRRATSSFSPSTRLGHGGFGSVYKAILPGPTYLAVKLMDPNNSLQGESEFHNELSIASSLSSPVILSLLGFSSNRKKNRLALVYEYMPNKSLQDALLDKKHEQLMEWSKRFSIAVDVAKGLCYLHHLCDPPVIHGDIKPSNVLLDGHFRAKIGDFGLAKFKMEDNVILEPEGVIEIETSKKVCEDSMSILEESGSLVNGEFEDGTENNVEVANSPESSVIRVVEPDAASVEVAAVLPEVGSMNERGSDKVSVESSGKDVSVNNGGERKGNSRKDWWWRQDNVGESKSGRVKDYVVEWIGSEINKERPSAKREWAASPSSRMACESEMKNESKRRGKRRFEWWASLDEDRMLNKEKKNRKPKEWWKEEFCEELTKKKRRKEQKSSNGMEMWWERDDDLEQQRKQRKSKSSRSSLDRWLDGLSGELRNNGRRSSLDWGCIGDIPKSGGVSSTPSMRGTVCYIAPEYGGGGQLSEKCDVYSYGVLLLVLMSGRRPLQVTASPMISEFERANLISWARQLAHNGKLLDLVDQSIHSLDKDQALLCITIALLCLQRSPHKRPYMKEVLGMLEGESEPPPLPFEFSPSPPSNFGFRSRQKAR